MKTRFYDLTVGELREFERILSEHFSAEDVRAILKNPDIMKDKSYVLLAKQENLHNGMFNSIPAQIELLKQDIKNGDFPEVFTEENFATALNIAKTLNWSDDPLTPWIVVPYLETIQETASVLFKLIWKRQKNSWKWDEIEFFSEERIRLYKGIEHPCRCLRFEQIDLGVNLGLSPYKIRNMNKKKINRFPHLGILGCGAFHPEWIKQMDGKKVPYVKIIGFEVFYNSSWSFVPLLAMHNYGCGSGIELLATQENDAHSENAIPLVSKYMTI